MPLGSRTRTSRLALAIAASLSLFACSGGGGTTTSIPFSMSTNAPVTPTTAQMTVTISNPPPGQAAHRVPQALSSAADHFVLYWDHSTGDALTFTTGAAGGGEANATNAGSVVAFTATVPTGVHDFTLLAYKNDPGCPQAGCTHVTDPVSAPFTGSLLLNSGTKTAFVVVAGVTSSISFVLDALVASLKFAGSANATVFVTEGTSTSSPASIGLEADDASGTPILAQTGNLVQPITLTYSGNGLNEGSKTAAFADGGTGAVQGDVTNGSNGFGGNTIEPFAYGLYQGNTFVTTGQTFYNVSTPMTVKYWYRAIPPGDTNPDGAGILNTTITATASGAVPATVTIISKPALDAGSGNVKSQLESPSGSASGACAAFQAANGTSTQVFGYVNSAAYRIQIAAQSNAAYYSATKLNALWFTTATGIARQSSQATSLDGNPIFLKGTHASALTVTYQNQNAQSVAWALSGNNGTVAAICPSSLYVTDITNNLLDQFSLPTSGSSVVTESIALQDGSGNGLTAEGIGVDLAGRNLYIAGGNSASVQTLGLPLTATSAPSATVISNGVNHPIGVTFDVFNNLYVANSNNNQVNVFAPPYSGAPAATFTASSPAMLAFDASGNLYVAGGGGVAVFTGPPPIAGGASPAFTIPAGVASGLAFDAAGSLYVTNSSGASPTIKRFDPPFSGASSAAVTVTTTANSFPFGLAVDPTTNTLYVGLGANVSAVLAYNLPLTNASTPAYSITIPFSGLARGVTLH